MPATEWRDMYCATGGAVACGASGGCVVSDAAVMPMQLAPLESVPQAPAPTPAPIEDATPAAPATDQPLFQPPRSESLPPLGQVKEAFEAAPAPSDAGEAAWEAMDVAEVADDASTVATASAPVGPTVARVAEAAPFVPPAPTVNPRVAPRAMQAPQPAIAAGAPWLTGPAGQIPTPPRSAGPVYQAPASTAPTKVLRLEGTSAEPRTEIRLAAESAREDATSAGALSDESLEASDNPFGRWLRR